MEDFRKSVEFVFFVVRVYGVAASIMSGLLRFWFALQIIMD